MIDILAAAEYVKSMVEADEDSRFLKLTLIELDAIHTYQFTMPTSPKPGFVYKREFWRIPGERRWWTGPNLAYVRLAIGLEEQGKGVRSPGFYRGPLESFWHVYTCVADPNDKRFVLHEAKEVKVIS